MPSCRHHVNRVILFEVNGALSYEEAAYVTAQVVYNAPVAKLEPGSVSRCGWDVRRNCVPQ